MNKIVEAIRALELPCDQDAEKSVLFLLIRDGKLLLTAKQKLQKHDFHNPANRQIFTVLCKLSERNAPNDVLTVVAEGKVLGLPLVTEQSVAALDFCADGEPTEANLVSLTGKLRDLAVRRQAILGLLTAASVANSPGTTSTQLERYLENKLADIRNLRTDDREATSMGGLLDVLCGELETRMAHPNGVVGVPTGIYKIDDNTGGFRPGELVVISGWTGRGKSTLVLQSAIHAAKQDIPAVIYSLEMSDIGTADRLGAMLSGIDNHLIRKGRLDVTERSRLVGAFSENAEIPFWHDFVGGMSVEQVCARARLDAIRKKTGIIFIDHIGKLYSEARHGSREQEMSAISGALDNLADELHIPVVMAVQMNRPFTPTGDVEEPLPSIHKLRDSGRIEQDSDWVIFTHRPNIKKTTEERISTGNYDLLEKAFLIIGKGRAGESELMIPVLFDGRHSRFLNTIDHHANNSPA